MLAAKRRRGGARAQPQQAAIDRNQRAFRTTLSRGDNEGLLNALRGDAEHACQVHHGALGRERTRAYRCVRLNLVPRLNQEFAVGRQHAPETQEVPADLRRGCRRIGRAAQGKHRRHG